MNANDNENREPEPVEPDEEGTDSTAGGGPASVIYGDGDADEADEIAEEMLKAPDEDS